MTPTTMTSASLTSAGSSGSLRLRPDWVRSVLVDTNTILNTNTDRVKSNVDPDHWKGVLGSCYTGLMPPVPQRRRAARHLQLSSDTSTPVQRRGPSGGRKKLITVEAIVDTAPGISRAALAIVPTNLETLRVNEGMFSIVLAGGFDPQTAAWAIDALTLYVNAYCLETSLRDQVTRNGDNWVVSRDDLLRRFAELPDTFPQTKRYAAELTAGTGNDRFDFTINLILDGLQR